MKVFIKRDQFKKALKQKMMTQLELADEIGVHKNHLSRVVMQDIPSGSKLTKAICEKLNCKFDQLFEIKE